MLREWEDEEDFYYFEGAAHPLVACRNQQFGTWCGYLGIPDNSTLWKMDYENEVFKDVVIHGGLTYAGWGLHFKETLKDLDRELPNFWWIGFDCAHYLDLYPWITGLYSPGVSLEPYLLEKYPDKTYKNIKFVENELRALSEQINAIEGALLKNKGEK